MNSIKIKNKSIGENFRPFIIAEMSGNHNGSLERAKKLVKAAAFSGADAIKMQTYTADTITMNHRGKYFDIKDKDSLWYGKNLYELYQEAHTPWEWHEEIFKFANKLGLIAFSSPFDESAIDFLEKINTPAYKIASFESNHFPLLKKVAETKKPIFISTGTSSINEIYESIDYLKTNGAKDIVLFKCTSSYPASPKATNLNTIKLLKSMFPELIIGLSDHTKGIGVSIASISLGARVIEKHFTLKRTDGGVDSAFSIEPDELKALVKESNRAFQSLGSIQLKTHKSELKNRQFRRSIYVTNDIKKNEKLSKDNIKVIRPGDGLHPKYWTKLLTMSAVKNIKKGTPMSWDLVI